MNLVVLAVLEVLQLRINDPLSLQTYWLLNQISLVTLWWKGLMTVLVWILQRRAVVPKEVIAGDLMDSDFATQQHLDLMVEGPLYFEAAFG